MNLKRPLIVLVLAVVCQYLSAYDFEENGIFFKILSAEDNTVEITAKNQDAYYNKGYKGDVVIPSTVTHDKNEYKVVGIGNYCFQNCDSLLSITLPETIEYIGIMSFYDCRRLSEIDFPKSLKNINEGAFMGCQELRRLAIPDNVETLEGNIFRGCRNLYEVEIGNGIKLLPYGLFSDCNNLQVVNFGNKIEQISTEAFSYCVSLQNIKFPENLRIIERDAFLSCENIQFLNLADTRLESVGEFCFRGCYSLIEVYFPASLNYFSPLAFRDCPHLEYYEIIAREEDSERKYSTHDGCIFDAEMTTLILAPTNRYVSLPQEISALGDYSFAQNNALSYLDLNENITHIGRNVFSECYNLRRVYLSPQIEEIPEESFAYCGELNDITFPENLKMIGEGAFRGCGLNTVNIHSDMESIGREAFSECINLENVEIRGRIKEIGEYAFYNCYALKYFYCESPLPETKGWEIFRNDIVARQASLDVFYEYDEDYRFSPFWGSFRYINGLHTIKDGLAEDELQTLQEVMESLYQKGLNWEIDMRGPDGVLCAYGLIAENGYVKEIELPGFFSWRNAEFPEEFLKFKHLKKLMLPYNGFSGTLDKAVFYLQNNPECGTTLQEIDLSFNNLEGNIGLFGNAFPELYYLNLSNNRFTDINPIIPLNVTDLNIKNQKTDFVAEIDVKDIMEGNLYGKFPLIIAYNHGWQNFENPFKLVINGPRSFNVELLRNPYGELVLSSISSQNVYYGKKGGVLDCYSTDYYSYFSYPDVNFQLILNFEDGDANFSGYFDIADIQSIINYIFDEKGEVFNFTAADVNGDEMVNVQDVVVAVNMLLMKEMGAYSRATYALTRQPEQESLPQIYISDGEVILKADTPISALHLSHNGEIIWDIESFGLNQATGPGRLVAYSLNGATLPAGENVIGHLNGDACLLYAEASDSDASLLGVDIKNDLSTRLELPKYDEDDVILIYTLQGVRVSEDHLIPGEIYIKNGKKFVAK